MQILTAFVAIDHNGKYCGNCKFGNLKNECTLFQKVRSFDDNMQDWVRVPPCTRNNTIMPSATMADFELFAKLLKPKGWTCTNHVTSKHFKMWTFINNGAKFSVRLTDTGLLQSTKFIEEHFVKNIRYPDNIWPWCLDIGAQR